MRVTYKIDIMGTNKCVYETIDVTSIEVLTTFINIITKDGKKIKINFNNLLLIESGDNKNEE